MISLLARNAAHLNLTPVERAILKVMQGALISVLLAALPAAAQGAVIVLNQSQSVPHFQWLPSLAVLAVSLAHTAAAALNKYWTAQGDPAIVAAFAPVARPLVPAPAPQPAVPPAPANATAL